MRTVSRAAALSSASLIVATGAAPTLQARDTVPFYTPFYGTSANGFMGAARGWNSFGIQAANDGFKHDAGWDFNDYHMRQQCDLVVVEQGFDYVCSIDSGWSVGCNGDANGVPTPDTSKFPNMKDLADHLHSRGMKLGLYVVPGAFTGDAQKTVHDKNLKDTGVQIGSLFDASKGTPLCRGTFDYSKNGVQQWHDSVVATFLSWGVDMLKLGKCIEANTRSEASDTDARIDYITPGSPDNGADMPPDNSGTVKAYHQAIMNNNAEGKLRLDISWKLDRSDPYWGYWQSSADSLRLDQDINNSGSSSLVAWQTVLRTINYYREFINEQTQQSRQQKPIMIRPDMDNMYVGNKQSIGGLSDVQRYTMAMHWVGAGANLIVGSDETRRDDLGYMLLTDGEVYGKGGVADFTQQYPMQPRNPSGWGTAGGNAAMQAQAWIAGMLTSVR